MRLLYISPVFQFFNVISETPSCLRLLVIKPLRPLDVSQLLTVFKDGDIFRKQTAALKEILQQFVALSNQITNIFRV
jgi:hypothetical protein